MESKTIFGELAELFANNLKDSDSMPSPLYPIMIHNLVQLQKAIPEWKAMGYSEDEVDFRVLREARLALNNAQNNTGVNDCLSVLDARVFELAVRLINSTQSSTAQRFAFARDRGGFLEAAFAWMFYEDKIFFAANQTAHLSQMVSVHHDDLGLLAPVSDSSPPLIRKDTKDSAYSKRTVLTRSSSFDEVSGAAPVRPSKRGIGLLRRRPIASTAVDNPTSLPQVLDLAKISSKSISQDAISQSRLLSPSDSILHSKGSSFFEKCSVIDLIPPQKQQHSTLGYLIDALCIWEQKLKDNRDRKQSDIIIFSEKLSLAKSTHHEPERHFIMALIWWSYFISLDKMTEKYDEIWLTDQEKQLYERTLIDLSFKRKKSIDSSGQSISQYVLIKIIKYKFDAAIDGNFPFAALTCYRLVMPWFKEFNKDNEALVREQQQALVSHLREAVLAQGYLFPLSAYYELIDIIKPTILPSEEETQRQFNDSKIAISGPEAGISVESFQPFQAQFNALALNLKFPDLDLCIAYHSDQVLNQESGFRFTFTTSNRDCKDSYTGFLLQSLAMAQKVYCFAKKVRFSTQCIGIKHEEPDYFSVLGLCSEEVYQLLSKNIVVVRDSLARFTRETLVWDQSYLQSLDADDPLKKAVNLYTKAIKNQSQDLTRAENGYHVLTQDLVVISDYLEYFMSKTKSHEKQLHPLLLFALAHLQNTHYCLYEMGPENNIIPHILYSEVHPRGATKLTRVLITKENQLRLVCAEGAGWRAEEPVQTTHVVVRQADIAVLGIIQLIEAKNSPIEWDLPQITPIFEFLREASLLPRSAWQWEETFNRLQSFAHDFDLISSCSATASYPAL